MKLINQIKQRYRYSYILLRQLVITDFKIRYKSSVLGYVWTLLKPLAFFSVLYVVFVGFLRVGDTIPHYAAYLLLGVLFWNFFVEVTNNGVTSIVGKVELLRKLAFPRYVVVLAVSFSALISLGINMVVITGFMALNHVPFSINILWLIPLVVELFIFSLSVAFILSALFVRYRDINYIWEVVLQAGFYATPILYPIILVINKFPVVAKIMMLNPIAQIIQDARYFVITDQTVTINILYQNNLAFLMPIGIVAILAIVGGVYFKKQSPKFAEEI